MAFLRKKGQRGRKGKKFANLFQKLARCSVCGSTMGYHNATQDKTRKGGVRPWAHYLTCNSAHAGHGCSNRRYFNYMYLENFVLSGTMDDLDIVAAAGIHDVELKQHTGRVAALEAQLDHVAVSIQKFMTLLKTHKLEGIEEIGQELTELQRERHTLNDQLAQARAEATAARQAAEDSRQFREHSKVDAPSPDTGLPAYVDMSDEAIYARRARIALQMRSVIESIACSPDHTVKIVMKTGTAYELIEKDWICTRQGPLTPSGKPAVAKSIVGRATWQLGQTGEPAPDGHEGATTAWSEHSFGAAKGKRRPDATNKRPRSAATPENQGRPRKMPRLLGRRRVQDLVEKWAQEHVVGADALARPAQAVLPKDGVEGGAGLERQHFAAGVLSEEPQDELRR
ncbi:MAG: zinc ribbon domain-containing protein, partial [Humidesulfovibrio sp.]|nr:zinc ribbon domain-containing protein [Humidesulfovibrio sp.]